MSQLVVFTVAGSNPPRKVAVVPKDVAAILEVSYKENFITELIMKGGNTLYRVTASFEEVLKVLK